MNASVYGTAFVGTSFLLVLLFSEAFSLSRGEITKGFLSIRTNATRLVSETISFQLWL